MVLSVVEYLDDQGESPFGSWFNALEAQAAARIVAAVGRMEQGNFSAAKSIGGGVWNIALMRGRVIASISGATVPPS